MGKKLLRNNSNLYEHDAEGREYFRAVRKERWKKVEADKVNEAHHELLLNFEIENNQQLELHDFRLDVALYIARLSGVRKEAFMLFMRGYLPKQVSACLGIPVSTAYYYKDTLIKGFKKFYLES